MTLSRRNGHRDCLLPNGQVPRPPPVPKARSGGPPYGTTWPTPTWVSGVAVPAAVAGRAGSAIVVVRHLSSRWTVQEHEGTRGTLRPGVSDLPVLPEGIELNPRLGGQA